MADDALIHSAATECDAHFLGAVRTRLNARTLVRESEVALPAAALERLLKLAFAGMPVQRDRPLIGYLRACGIDDASGEYFAMLVFAEQAEAKRAGALLYENVQIEIATPLLDAANEESHHHAK